MAGEPAAGPGGPDRIDGLPAFQRAVRDLVAQAGAQGWTRLAFIDPDFAHWPLGEAAVVEAFAAWMRPGRRLLLVAADPHALAQHHPRWLRWHAPWAHAVECRCAHEHDAPGLPTLALADHALALRLHDAARWRGVRERDAAALQRTAEAVQAIEARSGPGPGVTTLGL